MDADLRARIIRRDGGCVARFVRNALWRTRWPMLYDLPDPGPCRNAAGEVIDAYDTRYLTIDEVKIDAPGQPGSHFRMAKKAGYSMKTCVAVCVGHHVFGKQWSTSKVVREAFRLYLEEVNR